jgi:hypothetical protein
MSLTNTYAPSPGVVEFEMLSTPVNGGATIFGGAIVCVDAQGMANEGSDTAGLTVLGKAFVGTKVDNSAGSDGDKQVTTLQSNGRKLYVYDNDTGSPVTQADYLQNVYVFDDHTVAHSTVHSIVAGKFMGFLTDDNGNAITSKCLLLFPT